MEEVINLETVREKRREQKLEDILNLQKTIKEQVETVKRLSREFKDVKPDDLSAPDIAAALEQKLRFCMELSASAKKKQQEIWQAIADFLREFPEPKEPNDLDAFDIPEIPPRTSSASILKMK